jgi:hypothetical protein
VLPALPLDPTIEAGIRQQLVGPAIEDVPGGPWQLVADHEQVLLTLLLSSS